MSANFSDVMCHLANELVAHADRDGLTGIQRAVFLDRGGHAPGTRCPSEPAWPVVIHEYWCLDPEDECIC